MKLLGLLLGFMLYSATSYGQLPNFTLTVDKTDESCTGNGTLTFTTDGINPLASLLFTVYKYPNLSVPISVSATNSIGSLTAGSYKVVAAQILNTFSNSKEQDIVINLVQIPLAYTIASSHQNCSQGGHITITPTAGHAAMYEIISGPVTRPLQSSNSFSSMPSGTYNIRVFDDCGEGVVTTYTLQLNPVSLSISDASFIPETNPNCNTITVSNTITSPDGTTLSYPLVAEYKIIPPDGSNPITISQPIATGNPSSLDVLQQFQTYGNLPFLYDLKIVDDCGTEYKKPGIAVNPSPIGTANLIPNPCGQKYAEIVVSNFVGPYTLDFIEAPAIFTAGTFNSLHPGAFPTSEVTYGSETNTLPTGNYKVEITDACLRKGFVSFSVINDAATAGATGSNNGCFSQLGRINAVVTDREIVTASVTSGPASYSATFPVNVSGFVNNGKLILLNVPLGTYDIDLIDNCTTPHNVTVVVPAFVEKGLTAVSIPDCTPGSGSVQVKSGNGQLIAISVIGAPAAFTESLPFNVTTNIDADGSFFMSSLPAGDYIFKATDICNLEKNIAVTVDGYQPDSVPYTFIPTCGSFDVEVSDASPLSGAKYWLQRKNPGNGQWGHPLTSVIYAEGTQPEPINSITLTNNAIRHNLTFSGDFRVIKSFESYNDGGNNKKCVEILGEFSYSMDLEITNAYTLACNGNPNDVLIEAENGLHPYTYKIKERNGVTVNFNNGNSNIFQNLQPGIYLFTVEDACGSIAPLTVNINTLPSLVDIGSPQNIVLCTDTGTYTNHPFDLSTRNTAVLNGQSADLYTITYHVSQEDADNAVDALPLLYNNLHNNQIVYARLIHKSIPICHETASFKLIVGTTPVLNMPVQYYICDGDSLQITADTGFDEYTWSNGDTTQTTIIKQPGTYTLTVGNIYGTQVCPATIQIIVSPSAKPEISNIEEQDWNRNHNSITVVTAVNGNYEYSLDEGVFQPENSFGELEPGVYTVNVKDKNGCGITSKEFSLLDYPRFFTPNQDGHNEKWRIKFSTHEPNMSVYIYDRYGKLITGFDGMSDGWDGTLNGAKLPATDYWFVVERENGKVHKGHFSLLR